jgi:cytochrome c oxidase subunit 2
LTVVDRALPRRAEARIALCAALCLVHAVLTAAEPALGAGSQDALRSAGPQASHVVDLWRLMLFICTAVFSAILLAFLWALWRAPRAQADTPADLASLAAPELALRRSVVAAVAVSIVLLLVLVGASVATDRALARMALRDGLHIEVTAHQWWWEAHYDDHDVSQVFDTANELHVPVGKPVIVTLKSDDVIHSLWVPNLAGKKDLIPGRTSTLQFRADLPGTYRGQCAEFCGAQHAWMAFVVVAEPQGAYDAWAGAQRRSAAAPADARLARGRQIFMQGTCVMCHNVGGTEASARHAPDLTHVGSRSTLAAGTLPNTPQHLASWISNPQAHKPGVDMPATVLPPDELQALVAWLESLK